MWTATIVLWSSQVQQWKRSHFLVNEWIALYKDLFMEINKVVPWLMNSLGREGLVRSQMYWKAKQTKSSESLGSWAASEGSTYSFCHWWLHCKQRASPKGNCKLLKCFLHPPGKAHLLLLALSEALSKQHFVFFTSPACESVNWSCIESNSPSFKNI